MYDQIHSSFYQDRRVHNKEKVWTKGKHTLDTLTWRCLGIIHSRQLIQDSWILGLEFRKEVSVEIENLGNNHFICGGQTQECITLSKECVVSFIHLFILSLIQ